MTVNSRGASDKAEAVAERARLQRLLDDYDAERVAHEAATGSNDIARQMGPDRAGKVRARIAGLDEILRSNGD